MVEANPTPFLPSMFANRRLSGSVALRRLRLFDDFSKLLYIVRFDFFEQTESFVGDALVDGQIRGAIVADLWFSAARRRC